MCQKNGTETKRHHYGLPFLKTDENYSDSKAFITLSKSNPSFSKDHTSWSNFFLNLQNLQLLRFQHACQTRLGLAT